MKTARRSAALLSSGALIALLAACGSDDGTVVEPGTGGTPTQGTETEGTETEGTETEGTETEGTETEGTETEGTETEGTEGNGSGTEAGSEIDPQELMQRMQSVDDSILGSFTLEATIDAAGQAMTMSGVADVRGDTPSMDIEMTMMGMQIHMIMVDGATYMSMPGMTEEGQFIEVPADVFEGELDPSEQIDMTESWEAWEQAESVRYIGRDSVDGEEMDHFVLSISSDVLLEEDPDMAEGLPGGLPDTVEYEVWVDDQNLMRKVVFDLGGSMSMEMFMSGWGEDVNVTAPAPEDIIDGSGLGF